MNLQLFGQSSSFSEPVLNQGQGILWFCRLLKVVKRGAECQKRPEIDMTAV